MSGYLNKLSQGFTQGNINVIPMLWKENYIKEIKNGLGFGWVESKWRQKSEMELMVSLSKRGVKP